MTGSRIDANHTEIRDGLRQAGRGVIDCTPWRGAGFDLLVLYQEHVTFVEVKSPGGKLTASERTRQSWIEAFGGRYVVVYSLEEALERTKGNVLQNS